MVVGASGVLCIGSCLGLAGAGSSHSKAYTCTGTSTMHVSRGVSATNSTIFSSLSLMHQAMHGLAKALTSAHRATN